MALSFWLAPLALLALQQKPAEVQRESYPDGKPRLEREMTRDARGQLIVQGAAKEWFENGQLAAKGRYTAGLKHGVWETWHENGEHASKGRFERGARKDKWSFWTAEGADDLERSGDYALERIPDAAGGVRAVGYRVDGRRQGVWRFLWPDGRLQFTGHYRNGVRDGAWVFFHQDGSKASLLLSGVYEGGVRVRALDTAQLAVFQPEEEPGLEVDRPVEPSAAPAAIQLPIDWSEPLRELESLDLASATVVQQLSKNRPAPPLVAALGCKQGFGWSTELTPAGLEQRREVVRSMRSLWELKRSDPVYWCIDLQAAANADALLCTPPLLPEDRPGFSEGRLARTYFAGRFQESKPSHEVVSAALDWLARHQRADGSWHADTFMADGNLGEGCDCEGAGEVNWQVGLTGLTLLAFLGDGNTPYHGPHRDVVARGLGFLLQAQGKKGGSFRSSSQVEGGVITRSNFIYEHILATYALAEASALTGHPLLDERLQSAVTLLLRARNPQRGWRYEIPANGDNDTSVTAWAVQALRSAEEAGVEVDPAAYDGALAWLDDATDEETGRCGYYERGSLSARLAEDVERFPADATEALTAASLLCRFLIGKDQSSASILDKQAQIVRDKRPVWDPDFGHSDFYYWYYAAHAMVQQGDPGWGKLLEGILSAEQRKDGDARGSWDPIDPWGSIGGRVYSTAMLALALEAPTRVSRASAGAARR
jgi:antitoxin component YwqK of YwqJK toxin-antitoxin module